MVVEAPRSFADRTAIGGGIDFSAAQFARSPFEAARRTIDVSGHGTNNAGIDLGEFVYHALGMTGNTDVEWEFV